jgi:multidrug efflux pump
MFSRFFIDRPIFATVLSIIITLIGGIALVTLPIAQYPRITPPSISVSINYPGANAQVVADTVAAPIEQQVTGVPGMLYMSSQSGNDGSYTLSVTFDVNTDLNTALVMVQNRVTLAMPMLPSPVQRQGITIRKRTPDMLMIVSLFSPDGRYDDLYLSNFALINLKDELLRVEGVSDANIFGERDYSIRAWLDPQKLAAMSVTATDVANAIRNQNLEAALGQVGRPPAVSAQAFQWPLDTLGRLRDPSQFGDIIIKSSLGQSTARRPGRAGAAPRPSGVTGLPGSGISDPLQIAGSMSTRTSISGMKNSSATNSSTATTTGGTGGVTTSGTSSDITNSAGNSALLAGGANTTGGASSQSGALTTGGAETGGGGTNVVNSDDLDPVLSALSIDATTGESIGGSAAIGGPSPPAVGLVRLRDVARVEMGAQNYNMAYYFNGKPAVGLGLYQLPGTNALEVGDRVRAKMKELRPHFPDGIEYRIGYDTTPYIRESVDEVFNTLRDAVILVTLVVLIFLQDWRAMVLPMIDVPVSLIGTFAVMAVMGFSLNNISLFGLVLAIGIVVDDAIVVLENIERQMAKGLAPREATLKAMEEITGPIIAITLVLCAVFIPCAFISGITGRFYKQFAVTIAASTVISAINALTMTPSRALLIFGAKNAKGEHKKHHEREALPWWIFGVIGGMITFLVGPRYFPDSFGLFPNAMNGEVSDAQRWLMRGAFFTPGLLTGLVCGWFIHRPVNALLRFLFRGFNFGFDKSTTGYAWTIGKGIRLRLLVLIGYAGLLGLTWWTFHIAPSGFVPQQDQGRLLVSVQLPDAWALERTQEVVKKVEQITRETPGVSDTIAVCGISFLQQTNSPNFASLFVILKPFRERQSPDLKDEAIMQRLRAAWAQQVKDARVVIMGASPIPGLSVAGGFKIMVEDKAGLGLPNLQSQTQNLIGKLRKNPGLASVTSQFRSSIPQLFLDIDRTKVAALGLNLEDVNQTVQMYLGSLYVNSFNEFGRHFQVTVQAEGEFRNKPEDLNLFQVRNRGGRMVPLGTIATLREINGPIFVNRFNLSIAAPITGSLLPGVSSGEVIASTEAVVNETLPRSMKAEWTELIFMQIKEGNTSIYVFALGVMCVFLALAALYESWTLPLAVILVVPLCILCSVAGALLTNYSVNIFVQIGMVVLVGLACKNAILVVEFAKTLHQQGKSVYEATVEASRLRLRPILMTSFAFILGVFPLVISSGAGAEMRKSLGIAVFSGMIGVTFFGIFLTPVFFSVIQGIGETRFFSHPTVQWIASCLVSGLIGLACGYLLEQLRVVLPYWGMAIGAGLGVLAAVAVRGIHARIRGGA